MTKIRVHEYAKRVNKSSKEVIEELKKLNITVSNHMSTLTVDALSQLDNTFKQNSSANNQGGSAPKQNSSANNQGGSAPRQNSNASNQGGSAPKQAKPAAKGQNQKI